MVTTREIKGTKEQIVEQIGRLEGHIVSAILVVEEPVLENFKPLTDEEFKKLWAEMEADTVSVPNVDYSREAMYTRMPGE